MSPPIPGPIGPATAAKRGTMSAADKTKLDAYPDTPAVSAVSSVTQGNGLTLTVDGVLAMDAATADPGGVPGAMSAAQATVLAAQSGTNTGDVTVSSPTGWLSRVGQALTFALVSASQTVAGVVDLAAQTFAGVKTFAAEAVFSAGLVTSLVRAAAASLVLRSSLGAGASDECVVIGTSETDGGTHTDAKVLVIKQGIGGTPVERFSLTKTRAKVTVAAGSTFADPVLWFDTTVGVRENLIQFGTGLTSTTWEFSLGLFAGPFGLIKARSGCYISTPFFNPLSPNTTSLGSAGNHWASAFLGGTLRLGIGGGARPAADATTRGTLWYSKSAGGAADTIEICLKSAGDTYSWVTIATG